jgi:hypothetical protein
MKKILKLITTLFLCAFLSSCNKYLGDPTNLFVYDVDTQKFIDSSGITDQVEKFAVNNFVKQLKDSSLWEKFLAVYPMLGGTAATAKWNLKDPRNLDAAYRLTFNGTPVFAATGVLFPTIADYAETHLADSAIGGYSNSSISYYSRTQNAISGYDMGCTDGAIPYNELSIIADSPNNSEWFGFKQNILTANTTGLFMLSSSSTNVTRYRNGVVVSSKGSAPNNSYTNLTILIGKSRVSLNRGQKECALATIGYGLTDAQALTFYNIVQYFVNALSR